jgi:class 3 adenylate cyclase
MRRKRVSSRRLLATVLFSDIVGSTELATKLGDLRWRHLLAAHHAVVRGALRRFGGQEIDTAGDGFLATFDQPLNAVDCASAIVGGLKRIGLDVRVGLHTGEIERTGKDVGGIGVHIGARVAAQAGAGEILVSGTLRDLVSGAGLTFDDRGTRELKGVTGEWRLFAVEVEKEQAAIGEAIAESVRKRRDVPDVTASPDRTTRHPVRRRATIAAVVAALVTVGAVGLVLATRESPSAVPTVNSVVGVDPKTGAVRVIIPVDEGPTSIVAAGDQLWVASFEGRSVTHIDAKTMKRIGTEESLGRPTGITYDRGHVWVSDLFADAIYVIDAERGRRLPSITGIQGPESIAFGFDSLWVASSTRGVVERINVETQQIQATIDVGPVPQGIVVGSDAVWVASSINKRLIRIDPASDHVVARVNLCCQPSEIALGPGVIWVASTAGNALIKVDASTNLVSKTETIGAAPLGVLAVGSDVWVGQSADGAVLRLDGRTLAPKTRVALRGSVRSMAFAGGLVWMTVRSI